MIVEFDLATEEVTRIFRTRSGSVPHAILNDPLNPGILWFSEEGEEPFPEPGGANKSEIGQSRMGRIDSNTGQIEEFTGGLGLGVRMHGFNFDASGEIWAGFEGPDQVARFDRNALLFTDFLQFSEGSGPHAIYPGPPGDSNLYVVLQDSNRIGVFDPAAKQVAREVEIPGLKLEIEPGEDHGVGDAGSIVQFVAGPDGTSIWFTEFLNDRVGRLDLNTFEVTEYFEGIRPNAGPLNIAHGPDGNIWFSEAMLDPSQPSGIARIDVQQLQPLPELFGPSPYLSVDDTPNGFLPLPCDQCIRLEDFEDGSLDFGLEISTGMVIDPDFGTGLPNLTDSVDVDDGVIDGTGQTGEGGYSWFAQGNSVLITLPGITQSAGVVWTDGDPRLTEVVFEAFDQDGNSLGQINAGDIADDSVQGTTEDDRFFGVRFGDGIVTGVTAMRISNVGPSGIEIDHIQFANCAACDETLDGDINMDGEVSFADFVILASNFSMRRPRGRSSRAAH